MNDCDMRVLLQGTTESVTIILYETLYLEMLLSTLS